MILPPYLFIYNPLDFITILLLAHALDFIYPFHRGFLYLIHPVHTSYVIGLKLGKLYSSKLRGVATWFAVVVIHLAIYVPLLYVSWTINRVLWIIVSAYILKVSMSLRLLIDIVGNVSRCLSRGDLDCAKMWTQQIVRRDVYSLDEEHVASAAIESLAESLVDGYTSPLLYFALLGPVGALIQRIANTLDSAIGYKHNGYRDVGWFSAKMDTILNYLPARLTALIIVLLAPLAKTSIGFAYRIWRRDCRKTESLNAGHPMSAMAGALMVRLEKIGCYVLGDGIRRTDFRAIENGIRVAVASSAIWVATTILIHQAILFLMAQ